MENSEEFNWGPQDDLGRLIEKKAYMKPDPGLVNRIMQDLRPKKRGLIRTLFLWLKTPMTVSVSPLTASLAAAFLILSAGWVFQAVPPNRTPDSAPRASAGHVPVVFRFRAADAQTVSVMGSFNHWDPKEHAMVRDPETGDWILRVNLSPGKHDYVFLVNGEKIASDPHADIYKADEYGNQNSILFVKGPNGQKI